MYFSFVMNLEKVKVNNKKVKQIINYNALEMFTHPREKCMWATIFHVQRKLNNAPKYLYNRPSFTRAQEDT